MFLDRPDEARTLYVQCRRAKVGAERSGETSILQDFAALRDAKLSHSLMTEIETLFAASEQADQGAVSSRRVKKLKRPR